METDYQLTKDLTNLYFFFFFLTGLQQEIDEDCNIKPLIPEFVQVLDLLRNLPEESNTQAQSVKCSKNKIEVNRGCSEILTASGLLKKQSDFKLLNLSIGHVPVTSTGQSVDGSPGQESKDRIPGKEPSGYVCNVHLKQNNLDVSNEGTLSTIC